MSAIRLRGLALSGLIALVPLCSSCGTWVHGYYETTETSSGGWRKNEGDGTCIFYAPVRMGNYNGVSVHSVRKGQVYLAVFFPNHELDFTGRMVRITSPEGAELEGVPLSYSNTLEVPQRFVIDVPSFTVNGTATPPLHAEFAWTDKSFYHTPGAW